MRRELHELIVGRARRLIRDGTCKGWREVMARADIETRCNAKTRKGTPCRARGLGKGRRCRFHGGMSTGPKKTPEGKARSLAAAKAGFQRWRDAQKAGAATLQEQGKNREAVTLKRNFVSP